MTTDTIAAVATPPGQGAVAVVRLSGPGAFAIAKEIFDGPTAGPRVQTFGRITAADGESLDEVLLTRFPGPRSYTGEDVVEIGCHGGMLVTQRILGRLLEAGARSAEGGEFTQRAFLNGKMDLTQAEAVMDVISAQTELALRSAQQQLAGRLGEAIERFRQDLIGILAHIEAYIDFPDEDIDPDTGEGLTNRLQTLMVSLDELKASATEGRILRHGVRTVICGAPNVGKSSLLNLLLGFDRAIVSSTAGTTRDTIEEVINLEGIPLCLIDTAGIREAADHLEQAGIERTNRTIRDAELVLEVFDGSQPREASPLSIPPGVIHLRLLNKADLPRHDGWPDEADWISISCETGEGMAELTDAVISHLMGDERTWGEPSLAVNARHRDALQKAGDHLDVATEQLAAGQSPEFVAIDLRSALDQLGQIVGKTDIEEILGEIFSSFCIGK